MKNFLSICKNPKITSICIGKFDGMHLAHQALFKQLNQEHSLILSIVQTSEETMLTPNREDFTSLPVYYLQLGQIKEMAIEDFVCLLKTHLPNLKKIVVGYDFRFGKNRIYHAKDLEKFFEVCIVGEIKYQGHSIHTGVIIEALLKGDITLVNAMLGREYCIQGEVVSGQGIGKKELVATFNLGIKNYILPQNGVYVTYTEIDSTKYQSVSFVGNRLSTDGHFCVETHLIAQEVCIKPKSLKIYFLHKLRDNLHFQSLAELKTQINQDIQQALQFFK